jgi:hypothetical protein
MDEEVFDGLKEDWAVIEGILPSDWQDKAKEMRALFIPKEFKDASTLLRVMLIHLSDGCSLRETAVRARVSGLVAVSDVALLKRLRKCGPWFGWMCQQLTKRLIGSELAQLPGKRVRLVDASVVCEPGATGSTWRLHSAVVKVVVAFLWFSQATFNVVFESLLGAVVGLRCTSSMGIQLRVEPDQRFG